MEIKYLYSVPNFCPNESCCHHRRGTGRFFQKKGYYRTRYNHQPVPRYRCKGCGKWFSSHTFRATYRQGKPHLNQTVYRLYCSAMTQRRIAKILKIDRKTVVRKFLFMSQLAREAHQQAMKGLQVEDIQFDEMESFEHTRLKPLSIVLAVAASGQILGVEVAQIPYKGPLAQVAQMKYGYRADHRPQARAKVIESLRILNPVRIYTDGLRTYRRVIRKNLPFTQHIPVVATRCHPVKRLALRRRNVSDPLFALNHCAAKIRHDLSRMARKVWTTTKRKDRLQSHLDHYNSYQNLYSLAV